MHACRNRGSINALPQTRFALLATLLASWLAVGAEAATFTYTRTTSNSSTDVTPDTADDVDLWSVAEGWDSEPLSASNTTLVFTGGDSTTPIAAGTTIYTQNDKGDFQLNQMTFTQFGTTAAGAPVVTLSGGLLDFVPDGAIAPKLTVNTGYLTAGAAADADRIQIKIQNNVRLGTGTIVTLGGGSELGTASSTIELAGASVILASDLAPLTNTSGSEPTSHINGKITGAYGVQFHNGTGDRASALSINNTGNDYTGHTLFFGESSRSTAGSSSAGRTLQLGASEVIPHGTGKGNLTISMGTRSTITFNLNGFNETVNGLYSGGQNLIGRTVTNTSSTTDSTFTVGGNNQDGYFIGVFGGTRLHLTKIGSGKQILSGTSSYGGDTRVSGGTLTLDFNDYNGATQTNAPSNHFTLASTIILDGGVLNIQGRDAGSAVTRTTTAGNSSSWDVSDTSGIVAGQSVSVFNNTTNVQYGTGLFVRSVDRVANRIYLSAAPGSPGTSTAIRFEFGASTSGQASQTLEGLRLASAAATTSTLDFGTTAGGVALTFNAFAQDNDGSILNIVNWSGNPLSGGGADQLLFATLADGSGVTAFEALFLDSEINFVGAGFIPGYEIKYTPGATTFEVVAAVPEPGSLSLLVLGGFALLRRRRAC